MSKNDDYATRNFLDFSYLQNYYKQISIDLSIQTNKNIPQQINFTGKGNGATRFLVAEKQKKKFRFFFRFINYHRMI